MEIVTCVMKLQHPLVSMFDKQQCAELLRTFVIAMVERAKYVNLSPASRTTLYDVIAKTLNELGICGEPGSCTLDIKRIAFSNDEENYKKLATIAYTIYTVTYMGIQRRREEALPML